LISLRKRIQRRWTVNAGVLYYIHTGSYIDDYDDAETESDSGPADEFVFEGNDGVEFCAVFNEGQNSHQSRFPLQTSEIFKIPSKTEIRNHCVKLMSRLCPTRHSIESASGSVLTDNNVDNLESLDPLPEKRQKSMGEMLDEKLAEVRKPKISPNLEPANWTNAVKKEMLEFDKSRVRGKYLQKVYEALLTIKPTSVESERAFSSAGYICNKIRSRMNDETLDILCFLRATFRSGEAFKM
jgi:hAT family C-terminal dimerisation region